MPIVPPLVAATDLDGFPGSPFKESLVRAGAAAVRKEAGWHIAPSIAETVWLRSTGGPWIFLRTLFLTSVTSVKDENGNELTGWNDKPTDMFTVGCVFRECGWPCSGLLQVEMTHGYDECPDDLLPVVIDRMSRRVQQESLGSRSVTFFSAGDTSFDETLGHYTIPNWP